MSSSYQLPDNEQKAVYVQAKFSEIARHYDLFNDLITWGMHRLWKRYMVEQIQPGAVVICDLCCGTGDIALLLAQKIPLANILGGDFSAGMLDVAKERNRGNLRGIHFLQVDAMRLPFADQQLDAITIGYGLRNVQDLSLCLRELRRVLKTGGRLITLDVGKVTMPVIHSLSQFYMFKVVPAIGKIIMPAQDMFDYLPHSTQNYPPPEELQLLMQQAGFRKIFYRNFFLGASVVHVAQN